MIVSINPDDKESVPNPSQVSNLQIHGGKVLKAFYV
jgi:hypothetical protein